MKKIIAAALGGSVSILGVMAVPMVIVFALLGGGVLSLMGVASTTLGADASAEAYESCLNDADACLSGQDATSGGTGTLVIPEGLVGDDYPWKAEAAKYLCSAGGDCKSSPLGGYYGECTDWVYWRLNSNAGTVDSPKYTGFGNAAKWRSAWEARGWTVSSTPEVGAVAWWTSFAGGAGLEGHVAYVAAVNGAEITIEEYNNIVNPHGYNVRTISALSVMAFLYPDGM